MEIQTKLDGPANANGHESRLVTCRGGSHTFKVAVIDASEKWLPATDVEAKFEMPVLGTNQKIRFNLTGLSLSDYEEAETTFPIPRPTDDNDEIAKANRQREVDLTIARKQCFLFEKSLRKPIPGNNIDEKAACLSQRASGEIDALYSFVVDTLGNLGDGGTLLQTYHEMSINSSNEDVVDFASFDDWKIASDTKYVFRMHRKCQDYIVEIPLRGISEELRKEIELQCKEPDPPRIPRKDPVTKRFDPSTLVPNYEDYSYRKSLRAISQIRIVKLFSACLPFEIPGGNEMQKYAWIGQRLVGDVVKLRRFIESELLGIGSRFNSFTNG